MHCLNNGCPTTPLYWWADNVNHHHTYNTVDVLCVIAKNVSRVGTRTRTFVFVCLFVCLCEHALSFFCSPQLDRSDMTRANKLHFVRHLGRGLHLFPNINNFLSLQGPDRHSQPKLNRRESAVRNVQYNTVRGGRVRRPMIIKTWIYSNFWTSQYVCSSARQRARHVRNRSGSSGKKKL